MAIFRGLDPHGGHWSATPFYCEENIWHLSSDPRVVDYPRAALLMSNAARCVAIGAQRSAPFPGFPVLWDYHVVLAVRLRSGWTIWDFDCTLGQPVALPEYLDASFGRPEGYGDSLAPYFRVIAADHYRAHLATDRRHMKDSQDGYRHPPPPWPTIGQGSNLMRLTDMSDPYIGSLVDLGGLAAALESLPREVAPMAPLSLSPNGG